MKIPRDDVRKDLVYFNKKIKDCKDKIHNLEKTIKCYKEDIKDLEYFNKKIKYCESKIKDCEDKIHDLEKTIKCHKEDIKDLEYALENDYHNG